MAAAKKKSRTKAKSGYVDGFVLTIPKKRIKDYQKMAKVASKVWRDHGAIDYYEAVGEDLKVKMGIPFTKLAKPKAGETVVFAWITYKSRKHRDQVNAKVMKDKRMNQFDPNDMPFDCNRMTYGGFKILVSG
jgi:uncharacterized protein YbaA (DUF1428 family)